MRAAPRAALLADRGVTRREEQVLTALAERLTNADIAARLYVSERTVESHVSALLRKLGAANRVELGDFAKQLHDQAGTASPRPPLPAPLALLADRDRFVGRVDELDRVRRAWRDVQDGHVMVVLVAGEAGIGKSRLVAEFAAEAHGQGARVMLGSCFDDRRVPFGPFAQAISADVATLQSTEVGRRAGNAAGHLRLLVPDLATGIPSATFRGRDEDPATVEAHLYDALYGYLTRAAADGPLVLVVEDVHWATSSTLGAIRHLARVSGNAPLLVVATARGGRPDVDPELTRWFLELGRLPAVELVDVPGLSEEEVADLLDTLDGRADPAVVCAGTGGNPLLVTEVAGEPTGRIGPLQALLERRYALLDDDDLATVDAAAVAGPVFDADAVAAALRRPLPAVVDALERAEVAGLVSHDPQRPGSFAFVHVLFRDNRYDGIPLQHRTELHRRLARALPHRRDGLSLPDLARHVNAAAELDEGDWSLDDSDGFARHARVALRQSGDRAAALNDLAAARRDYLAALELWPADDADRPALLLELGRTLFVADAQGADVLRDARDGLLALGDLERAAESEMLLGELAWTSSRWTDAQAHLDRAATLVEARPDSPRTARVTAGLARFGMIAGANDTAMRFARRAIEMARGLALPAVEANALHTLGPARCLDGDLGGISDLEAGISLSERLGLAEVDRGYANLSYVYGMLGETRQNRHWREQARAAAERFALHGGLVWARAHTIEDRFHLGQWDEALDGAEAFIAEHEAPAHYLVAVCLRVRASVRIGRGREIGALADASAALEFARGSSHPSNLLVALPFLARCLAQTGRSAEADRALSESFAAAEHNEVILEPLHTAIAALRLGRTDEYLHVAARSTLATKRWEAGRAIGTGDLAHAADLLAGMEQRSTEAFVRLLASERLAELDQREEAAEQLRRALAFHRTVGATAYVERGERLAGRHGFSSR